MAGIPVLQQKLLVTLVFFGQLGDVVFVLDPLTSFILCILTEKVLFFFTERDALGSKQLNEHFHADSASALGIQAAKGCHQTLRRCVLVLILDHCARDEVFDFLGGHVFAWLVLL